MVSLDVHRCEADHLAMRSRIRSFCTGTTPSCPQRTGPGRPGLTVAASMIVLFNLAGCDLEFRSGWFEDEWETEFRSDLLEPVIARGVNCDHFRYRRSTKWRDSYLVECSMDGENWDDSFLVWPRDGRARRH